MSLALQLGLVYLISELLLTITRRSRSRTGTKRDRSTLRVLWLVIMASVAAGIYVASHSPAAALPQGQTFAFAGVFLFGRDSSCAGGPSSRSAAFLQIPGRGSEARA